MTLKYLVNMYEYCNLALLVGGIIPHHVAPNDRIARRPTAVP